MPDPTTHAATVATAAPAVAVATTLAGITLWPFAVALAFAFAALIYQARMPVITAIGHVVVSALIGGALAQISANPALLVISSWVPSLTTWALTAQIPMTAFIAMVTGLFCHRIMPAAYKRADRVIGGE